VQPTYELSIATDNRSVETLKALFTTTSNPNGPAYTLSYVVPTSLVGSKLYTAATYDGTTAELYLNGAPVASMTPSPAAPLSTQAGTITIGGLPDGTQQAQLQGIQDVAIYGAALTAAQIANHYAVGSGSGAISFRPTALVLPNNVAPAQIQLTNVSGYSGAYAIVQTPSGLSNASLSGNVLTFNWATAQSNALVDIALYQTSAPYAMGQLVVQMGSAPSNSLYLVPGGDAAQSLSEFGVNRSYQFIIGDSSTTYSGAYTATNLSTPFPLNPLVSGLSLALTPLQSGSGVAMKVSTTDSRSQTFAVTVTANPTPTPAPTATPIPPPAQSGTGIAPWWHYEHEKAPGGDDVLVNVGTGNVVVEKTDMAVPYEGMGLVFRRFYNSQSIHIGNELPASADPVVDDYGDGWTNTFDAHVVQEPGNYVSVYDETGARWDYINPNGTNGTYTSVTPGQYATLVSDGGCGLFWTQKNGSITYFYLPNVGQVCGAQYAALGGRIYQLIGRNNNSKITLNYSWNNLIGTPGAYAGNTIAEIDAVTDQSQLTARLLFATTGGAMKWASLVSLIRPDGTTISYGYTGDALVEATYPANNSSQTFPTEWYHYGFVGLTEIDSPRYNGSCASDLINGCGASLVLSYSGVFGSDVVTALSRVGFVNPTVPDGTNSGVLQPAAPAGNVTYATEYYATNALPVTGSSAQQSATFYDTAGHRANWISDGFGRVIQTQACTVAQSSTCTGQYLISSEAWDSNNNLAFTVDPRGYATGNALAYETALAYDATGNVTAIAQPQATTSQGTFHPTELISYDAFNNPTAICSPNKTHSLGLDWTTPPVVSDSLCPHASGAALRTVQYPSYEPFGEVSSVTTPSGYSQTVLYSASAQNGTDYGLPTSEQGTVILQSDSTNRQPTLNATYDSFGRLASMSNGIAAQTYSYDGMGRLLTASDADLGSVKATTNTYFPDGSLATSQSPGEAAAGVSTAFAYDLDSNIASRTSHFNNTAAAWQYWYDGDDNLIERSSPQDPQTPGDFVGLTKSYRDWSQGAGVTSASGQAIVATGNVFDTLKWQPTSGWLELSFSSFDGLNRATADYAYLPCANNGIPGAAICQATYKTANGWDMSSASVGFLGSVTNAIGVAKVYAYDARGLLAGIQYSGDGGVTPAMQYLYDADGSVASRQSVTLGNETLGYSPDELLQSLQEPASMGGGSVSYAHYGDGLLQSVSVAGSVLTQSNLLTYSYRGDGLLQTQAVNVSGGATYTYAYTAAGRMTAMTDFSVSPSRTQSYDAYGRVSQYTIPAGTYSGLTYDAENDLTGYSAYGGESVSVTYNTRGESVGLAFNPNGVTNGFSNFPAFALPSIQGVQVQSPSETWDARTGAPVGYGAGVSMTYDAAGRLAQTPGGTSFTYDAENRVLTGFSDDVNTNVSCGTGNGGTSRRGTDVVGRITHEGPWPPYVYGPDGNIAEDPSGRRWHWSGTTLLYTDAGAGAANGLYLGAFGILPIGSSLTTNDLEFNGLAGSSHNATGNAPWAPPNPNHQPCVTQTPVGSSANWTPSTNGQVLLQINGDGTIDDGFNFGNGTGQPLIASALSSAVPSGISTAYSMKTTQSQRQSSRRTPQMRVPCNAASVAAAIANNVDSLDCFVPDPSLANPYLDFGGGDGLPIVDFSPKLQQPKKKPHLGWQWEWAFWNMGTCDPNTASFLALNATYATPIGGGTASAMAVNDEIYFSLGGAAGWDMGFSGTAGMVIPNAGNSVTDVMDADPMVAGSFNIPAIGAMYGANSKGHIAGLNFNMASDFGASGSLSVGVKKLTLPFSIGCQ
jgi:YD repeat-containing protein